MNQKKNKGLLITIIILLGLLIIVGTIACLYFFTDIFINNKQAFFKYTSQVIQTENGFIENGLQQYLEKKKSTNYENSGDISFEISVPGIEEQLELANNFNITYSGKTDPSNSKTEREITLNYSDDVNFPLTYRQTNGIMGIQTEYIGSSFVAIRNGEDVSGLEGITNFMNMQQSVEFSDEEIQNLKTTYFDNILNSLADNKFSKTTEGDLTGYKLTLTGEEFKNVLVQILETLKSDANTINKINVIAEDLGSSTEFDTDLIDNMIESINGLEITDNIELTVYENARKLNRIDIKIQGNTISINKEGNGQEVTYTVGIKSADETANISVSAKYTGLNTDNINENYEISLEGPYEGNTVSSNSSSNSQELQIETEKEEIQILMTAIKMKKSQNGEDSSQITDTDIETELTSGENESYSDISLDKKSDTEYNITFISTGDKFIIDNTGEIIEEPESDSSEESSNDNTENDTMSYKYTITNNVQFKDSVEIEDLTDENSAILNEEDSEYVTNLMNAIQERLTEVNKSQMEELGVSESENPIQYLLPSFIMTGTQNNTAQIDETAVNSFNQKFELYESTNTKGATVKGLLTTIQNNNETEGNNKIEEINVDGEEYEVTEQNITLIKSNINVDDAYRVEFEKDIDTGLIYRAVINKR